MCRFWAGGISSFPFSRAREYRLLRRLLEHQKILLERRNSIRTTPVNDIKNRGAFMQVFAVDDSTERGPFILLLITKF
jgi:hypothetical protein